MGVKEDPTLAEEATASRNGSRGRGLALLESRHALHTIGVTTMQAVSFVNSADRIAVATETRNSNNAGDTIPIPLSPSIVVEVVPLLSLATRSPVLPITSLLASISKYPSRSKYRVMSIIALLCMGLCCLFELH